MKRAITTITIALILTLAIPVAVHGAKTTSLSFTNIPLLRPDGNSEPELSIGPDGTTVYVALSWTQFFTNTWKAGFGRAPVFQGTIDANLANNVLNRHTTRLHSHLLLQPSNPNHPTRRLSDHLPES